jgi:predicted ester cyclase
MAGDLKELSRLALLEMFDRGHPEILEGLSWLSFIGHDPVRGTLSLGATRELAKGFKGGFPDLQCTILDAIGEGERVACRWRMSGTHLGTFLGFESTGRRVAVDGIAFFRFHGERVAEEWLEYDAFGLFRQLGLVPTMEELRSQHAGARPDVGGEAWAHH